MSKKKKFVIPPYNSFDITKNKKYEVLKDFGSGDVQIKNDAGEIIPVCTQGSSWTFECSWKTIEI